MTDFLDPGRRHGGASGSVDEVIQGKGAELITGLSALIRIGKAYSVNNQVYRTQLASLSEILGPILEHSGQVVYAILNEDHYLNGLRIPITASSFRFHRTVAETFRARGVSGFRVEPGVRIDDLAQFFDLLLSPSGLRGKDLVRACSEAKLQHIAPATHASTEPVSEIGSDFGEDPLAEGEPGRERRAPAAAARPGRGAPGAAGRRHLLPALQGARNLLTTTALTGGLEMRHAKRVVQPLVDDAFSLEPVVVGLSTLRNRDEFTYAHSINVCAIAVTMGHFLGLDRRALADLGVAALLHDVGKSAVADQILHPLEAFTEEERRAAERHAVEGAKLLARSTTLNATTLRCIRVALEHHVQEDGKGYPRMSRGWRSCLLSQIVAAADCYTSLHTRSGELLENITPYQALGMMLGPYRTRFEPALLWALVQSLGFYPPGQLVQLDNGFIASVLAPNPEDLARPHVRVVAGADGKLLPSEEVQELLPIPAEMRIVRALRGEEYPAEPEAPADSRAA